MIFTIQNDAKANNAWFVCANIQTFIVIEEETLVVFGSIFKSTSQSDTGDRIEIDLKFQRNDFGGFPTIRYSI